MINTAEALYKEKKSRIGATLLTGFILMKNINTEQLPISEFTFEMKIEMGTLVLFSLGAIFLDKKEFRETHKIKSFTSTFFCLTVILIDIGFYFYLV